MRRRMYFILPGLPLARTVFNELLLSRIPESHMHVIAREGINTDDLPPASLWQKSDLIHSLQLGIPVGALTGILIGVLAVFFGWINPGFEAKAILATVVAGLVIGSFAATLIAVNVPNTRHLPFEKDLRQGHILFIVDVPLRQVDEISEMVTRLHPDAVDRGIEPNIPAFP